MLFPLHRHERRKSSVPNAGFDPGARMIKRALHEMTVGMLAGLVIGAIGIGFVVWGTAILTIGSKSGDAFILVGVFVFGCACLIIDGARRSRDGG